MYWKASLGPDEIQETGHGASGESRVPHLKSRRAHLLTTGRRPAVVAPAGHVRSPRGIAIAAEIASQCRPACGHDEHRLRG